MHSKPIARNSMAMFSYKPYTVAGFETGSSVPQHLVFSNILNYNAY
jgi:hypothetical protein